MGTGHESWQICVQGHLGPLWQNWFGGMTVTNVEQGVAILSGPIADQAALYGVLLKVRDLGLPLLRVTRMPMPVENLPPNGDPAP